jgi:hypothetical protein
MMMGIRSSGSFFIGSIVGWYFIGHLLVEGAGWIPDPWNPIRQTYSLPGRMDPKVPGVGFWLLWPGLTMLVVNSISDIILSYYVQQKAQGNGETNIQTHNVTKQILKDDQQSKPVHEVIKSVVTVGSENGEVSIPISLIPHRTFSKVFLVVGGICSLLICIVVSQATFYLSFPTAVLAIVLGMGLSYIAVQASATTDMNPTGTLAKITKFLFSFVPARTPARHQFLSISGALISTGIVRTSDAALHLPFHHNGFLYLMLKSYFCAVDFAMCRIYFRPQICYFVSDSRKISE